MSEPLPPALARATIPAPVLEVIQGLERAGYAAVLVGGCVRDLLRGAPPKDFDIASSARPEQVQKVFKRVIPTGVEHGTVTVVISGEHVEVTTFRSEGGYVDGRRPTQVEFHGDVSADLSRRDFTINAMAFDPEGRRLVDPFGGQADLAAKQVRCVGEAKQRFLEDGLRAMRAVRFATVLEFSIDPATEQAIGETLAVFDQVAIERVTQEFSKLLLARLAPFGLRVLSRTGLLSRFLPEALSADPDAVDRAGPELTVRLAVLLAQVDDPKAVVMRLKYPTVVAVEVAHLVTHRALPRDDASDAQLRRWLSAVRAEKALDVLALGRAIGVDVRVLEARVRSELLRNPPLTTRALALNGAEIMATLGVGPSPLIGKATQHLMECVLEDPTVRFPSGRRAALWRAWPGSQQRQERKALRLLETRPARSRPRDEG